MNPFRKLFAILAALGAAQAFAQIDQDALRGLAFIPDYDHRYAMEDTSFYQRLMKSEIERIEAEIKAGTAKPIDYYDKAMAEDYLDEYEASGESFEKAKGMFKDLFDKGEGDRVQNQLYLALCLSELGEYEEALKHARAVVEENEQNGFALATLSHVIATGVLYELGQVVDYELMATDLYIALDEFIDGMDKLVKMPEDKLKGAHALAEAALIAGQEGVRLAPMSWESYRYQEAALVLAAVMEMIDLHKAGGDDVWEKHEAAYSRWYDQMMLGIRREALFTKGSKQHQMYDLINASEILFEDAYEAATSEEDYIKEFEKSGFFGAIKENVPSELRSVALGLSEKLEKLHAENPSVEPSAAALTIAYLRATRGEKDLAIGWAEKAAAFDPKWAEPVAALGTFLMAEDAEACKKVLIKGLEKNDDAYLRTMLAYMYELEEDYAEVEKQFEKLLKLDKENVLYRIAIVATNIKQGESGAQLDEDYEYLKKANAMSLEDLYERYLVWLHFGVTAGLKGKVAEAKEAFTALSKVEDEDWSELGKMGLEIIDGELGKLRPDVDLVEQLRDLVAKRHHDPRKQKPVVLIGSSPLS